MPYFGMSTEVWGIILVCSLSGIASGYHFGAILARQLNKNCLQDILTRLSLTAVFWFLLSNYVFQALSSFWIELSVGSGALISSILILFPFFAFLSALMPVCIHIYPEKSGEFLAISTIGAVAGAILCVFLLFPAMSLTYVQLLVVLPLTVVAITLTWKSRKNLNYISAFLSVITLTLILSLFLSERDDHKNILEYMNQKMASLETIRTSYGTLRILEKLDGALQKSKFFLIDGRSQSAFEKNGKNLSPTLQAMTNFIIKQNFQHKEILILGGGVSVTASDLSNAGYNVDVVDIIKETEYLTEKYIPETDNVSFYNSDARVFLNQCKKIYSVIILNTFGGYGFPEHMITLETFQTVQKLLQPEGIFLMNTLRQNSDTVPDKIINKTLSLVFPHTKLFLNTRESNNIFSNGLWISANSRIADNIFSYIPDINWFSAQISGNSVISRDKFPTYIYAMKNTFDLERKTYLKQAGIEVLKY